MPRLAAFEGFEFVEGAGPIGFEQAGQAAVGEDFAAGLADWAVVGFVVCVADALDWRAASGARLTEAAMDGHFRAECSYFFWESVLGFGVEAIDPELERLPGRFEEPLPFRLAQFACQRDRRELGGIQDFVRVGVADAAEDARIGEGSLEGAVFLGESLAKHFQIAGEDFDAAGVHGFERGFSGYDMQRGAPLGACFRKYKRAVGEVESGEIVASAELGCEWTPVQATGDHQVDYEPEIALYADGDALADAAQFAHDAPFCFGDGRLGSAKQECAGDTNVIEALAENASLDRGDVCGDVGQFRHVKQLGR